MPPRTRWAERPLAECSVVAAARRPATCAPVSDAAGTRMLCANRGGVPRRRAPRQPADRPGARAARPRAPSSPSIAVDQRACGRPRRGSVAAVLPHWSHDDGRLPQRVGSYARCHHLRPRATGSILGTNSRATQRADELAAADPVNRSQLGRRLELDARSRPEIWPCGAPFGHEAERALVRGKLVGCGALQWAVRRHAARASGTPRQNTGRAQHHDGSTKKCPFSNGCLGPPQRLAVPSNCLAV